MIAKFGNIGCDNNAVACGDQRDCDVTEAARKLAAPPTAFRDCRGKFSNRAAAGGSATPCEGTLQFSRLYGEANVAETDTGRMSCARKAAIAARSQGTARRSGREICSKVSISVDSHTRWPLPDRHACAC